MSDYCVQVTGGRVEVSRILNGDLDPIRFGGEASLLLDVFWSKFKAKVEYEADEQLAILVVADHDEFEIDSEISIAKEFISNRKELGWIIDDLANHNAYIRCYPEWGVQTKKPTMPISRKETAQPRMVIDSKDSDVDSLQTFFKKKTREYKRSK